MGIFSKVKYLKIIMVNLALIIIINKERRETHTLLGSVFSVNTNWIVPVKYLEHQVYFHICFNKLSSLWRKRFLYEDI